MTQARILVTDDQVDHLKAVQLILESAGYTVVRCTSGRDALDVLEHAAIDLILADIAMPQMNGYQLLEAVRKHPEWATIPFLFLTARALDSDVRYGKALGVDDYLTKPIEPEDLLAVVAGKLRRHQQLVESMHHVTPLPASSRLSIGQLEIDVERHKVTRGGQPLELSVREFVLLEYLARRVGTIVAARDLVAATHGLQTDDTEEARELIRPIIRGLRGKLACSGEEPGCIETVRGLGYRMIEPPSYP